MSKFKKLIVSASVLFPLVSYGQFTETDKLASAASRILTSYLIPIVFTLALLYFFWGVVKYIKSEGDGKAEGRQIMVWGVVALFVMSSIWGLVRFIQTEFSLQNSPTNIQIPTINGGPSMGNT